MTKQTWTAVVSAVLFVGLAAALALTPIPFVSWAAGATYDVLGTKGGTNVLAVSGIPTYPSTGELRLTTVSVTRVDGALSLPEAITAELAPDREVVPREAVYPAGSTVSEVRAEEAQMMDTSQARATAAALRTAGIAVTELPMVNAVVTTGPAHDLLRNGDLVTAVDGKPVVTVEAVRDGIRSHKVGEKVVFSVLREGVPVTVEIPTVASSSQRDVPIVGISLDIGYNHAARVDFAIDNSIGGPSAGLVFALGVYERVTPGDLIAGRRVAATGTITGEGEVGSIGAIQEKLAGAQEAGATIMLVPSVNCGDIVSVPAGLRVVPVATLAEAVRVLSDLADPAKADSVRGCS